MKTSLSIILLCSAICAQAQINQKTIELRKSYTKNSTYRLREHQIPASLQNSFLYKEKNPEIHRHVSRASMPQPSTQSIKKAFTYYNSLKKPVDLSGVLVVGYSLLSNQQFMIYNKPEETVKFFPTDQKQ
ncbi:MAG TPA: hypothetical protein VGD65_05000 [Chryseosolibacter sp.]